MITASQKGATILLPNYTVTSDGLLRHVSYCLETASRHDFSCLGLGSCLDTCMSRSWLVSRASVSRHVSCLMTFVLTMPLSGISKCLFYAESLAFLAESRPLGPSTLCLLTYRQMFVFAVVVVVLWL